ncbi:MAG: type II toxin-antitoxin system YafQ family toxin [Ruminococcus sp.]|jgi:mRNA interferase YafQ|nr:type II toxin-antitoxin system YafQ family toxin [Ruminococcus sp.]
MQKNIDTSKLYRKNFKKTLNRDKSYFCLNEFDSVLSLLKSGAAIPEKYRDHKLEGDMRGFRSLHIKPDWLLVYKTDNELVYLHNIGTHSDIYG